MTSFMGVTKDWLQEPGGVKTLIIAPAKKVLKLHSLFKGTNFNTKANGVILGRTNTLLNWYQIVDKVNGLVKSFNAIKWKDPFLKITEKSIVAASRLSGLVKMVTLAIRMCQEMGLFVLRQVHVIAIRSIGIVATSFKLLTHLVTLKNIIYRLKECQRGDPAYRLEMMNVANKICALIMGCFALGVFAFGGKVLVLAVGTASLVLSISKYYYREFFCSNTMI